MKYTFLLFLLFSSSLIFAQPGIQWQKCLGGTKNDFPGGMIQTSDGGYIMAGQTQSNDSDATSNHGKNDLWIVRMNSKGTIQWQKTYGGSQDDNGGAIIEALDGGYIIAASTNSDDGDLQGIRQPDISQSDVWIFKIDTAGKILWQKIYGGSKNDFATSIIPGGEGEYAVSAASESTDGDVKGYHGGSGFDIWVFQISQNGSLGWQKTFGGTQDDEGGIMQTSGGGFAIIGTTYSHDGDVIGRHTIDTTLSDVWLVKLSGIGDIEWQKTYGGSKYEEGNSLIETLDHGYAIAGFTTSADGDASGLHGSYFSDCWIVKTDNAGKIEWQKCLGGSNGDIAYSILQTSDSGYIVSANTSSSDGDVTGYHDNTDCWVFKLSKSGKLVWQKTFGGSASDANSGSGIMQTADSGFLIATVTSSSDGNVSGRRGDSTRDGDIWLVKLSPDINNAVETRYIVSLQGNIQIYPNPSIGIGKISYTLEKSSQVKIEIFNPLGESLRTFINTKEESGSHEHAFDISDLPSGSYYLRIQIGGISVVKTLEVVK